MSTLNSKYTLEPAEYEALPIEPEVSDWDSVENDHKQATYSFGNILKQKYGINASITGGSRTPELNAEVGGSPTSWHLRKRGSDLSLGISDENDPRVAKVLEDARRHGFEEVLYHNSGSGLHLHLGNYRGKPLYAKVLDAFPTFEGIKEDQDTLAKNLKTLYEQPVLDVDQAAKDEELARLTGVPLWAIKSDDENRKAAEAFAKAKAPTGIDWYEFQNQYPTLSKVLARPDNMDLMRDDLDALQHMEEVFNKNNESEGVLDALMAGYTDTKEGMLIRGAIGWKQVFADLSPEEEAAAGVIENKMKINAEKRKNSDLINQVFYGAGEVIAQNLDSITKSLSDAGKMAVLATAAGKALGYKVMNAPLDPTTLPTLATVMMAGFQSGMVTGQVKNMALIEGGNFYRDIINEFDENGNQIPKEAAKGAALLVGAINSGLELAQFNVLAKSIPGLHDAMRGSMKTTVMEMMKVPSVKQAFVTLGKEYSKSMSSEIGIEVLQETVSVLFTEMAKSYANSNGLKFDHASAGDIINRLVETAVESTKSFLLPVGVGHTVRLGKDINAANKATMSETFFKDLNEGVLNSKLLERSPGKMQELISDFIDKSGTIDSPLKEVYIDAVSLNNAINGDLELLAQLGIDESEYQNTVNNNGTFTVPTEVYATVVAPTELHKQLQNDIKMSEDSFTLRQRDEFISNMQTKMAEVAEEARKSYIDTDTLKQDVEFVRNEVVTQLQAANYEKGNVEKINAVTKVYTSWVETQVKNLLTQSGMTIDQLKAAGMPTTVKDFHGMFGARSIKSATSAYMKSRMKGMAFQRTDQGILNWAKEKIGDKIASNNRPASENFLRWFSNSVMTDEQGMPRVMFHSTTKDYDKFDPKKSADIGIHFGTVDAANERLGYLDSVDNAAVIPVYLRIQKPFKLKTDVFALGSGIAEEFENDFINGILDINNYEDQESWEVVKNNIDKITSIESLKSVLIENGFDGIEYTNEVEDYGSKSYVIFDPSQAKSAIGNNGLFDEENDNFLAQLEAGHISPHKFDRFSNDYSKTGEGVQAFGWGGYFWTSQQVRAHYMKSLRSRMPNASGKITIDAIDDIYQQEGTFTKNTAHAISQTFYRIINTHINQKGFDSRSHYMQSMINRLLHNLTIGEIALFIGTVGGEDLHQFTNENIKSGLKERIEFVLNNREFFSPANIIILDKSTGEILGDKTTNEYQLDSTYLAKAYEMTMETLKNENFESLDKLTDDEQLLSGIVKNIFVEAVMEGNQEILDGLTDDLSLVNVPLKIAEIALNYMEEGDAGMADMMTDSPFFTIKVQSLFKDAVERQAHLMIENNKTLVLEKQNDYKAELELGAFKMRLFNYIDMNTFSYESGRKNPYTYLVNLDTEDDRLMKWDFGIEDQSEYVTNALSELISDFETPGSNSLFMDLVKDNSTGASFYYKLANTLGSEREASLALAEAGIPGHKFYDGMSRSKRDKNATFNYVIYDDSIIEIKDMFSELDGVIRGAVSNKRDVYLTEHADISTFLHESLHLFVKFLETTATNPGTPKYFLDQYETLCGYFGKDIAEGLSVENHEKLAKMFESYMNTGEAPSVGLKGVFRSIRVWMVKLYKQLTQKQENVPEEIKAVFDRMLATENEIEQLKMHNSLDQVVEDVTDEERQELYKLVTEADNDAVEKLLKKVMSDRKKDITERKEREIKESIPGIIDELMKSPIRKIESQLESQFGSVHDLMSKFDAGMESATDTVNTAAELNNMDVKDLVRELNSLSDIQVEATKIATKKVNDKYNVYTNRAKLREYAIESINSDKRLELLAYEYVILLNRTSKKTSDSVPSVSRLRLAQAALQGAKTGAALALRGLSWRKAQRSEAYIAAARHNANLSYEALKKMDHKKAAEYKQKQMMNFAMAIESIKVRKEMDKYQKHFKQWLKSEGVQHEYHEHVVHLLNKFGFTTRTGNPTLSLPEFLNEILSKGEVISVDYRLIYELIDKNYKAFTVEEFREVYSMVGQLVHVGRNERRMLHGNRSKSFEVALAEVIDSLYTNNKKNKPDNEFYKSSMDKLKHQMKNVFASHTRIQFLIRAMDGFKDLGPIYKNLILPIMESDDTETTMSDTAANELKAIITDYHTDKERAEWKKLKYNVDGRKFSHEHAIVFALNWGTESSRQRVLSGWQLTEENVAKMLDVLTPADWKMVQDVWKFIDSYWNESEKLEIEMRNKHAEKIVGIPITTKYGLIEGGYYPLIYDYERSSNTNSKSSIEATDSMFNSNINAITVEHGFMHERVEVLSGMKIRLEFVPALSSHIKKVIHNLAFRRAIRDVYKLISNEDFATAVSETWGKEYYNQLMPWLRSIAAYQTSPTTSLEKILSWVQSGITISALGFKFSTGIAQLMGFFSVVPRLGIRDTTAAILDFYHNPMQYKDKWQWVMENSVYMSHRSNTMDRDIRHVVSKMVKDNKWDQVSESMFWFVGFMDYTVTVPIYLKAYDKGTVQYGTHELAIRYADEVISQTQNVGRVVEMAEMQRGGPLRKMFTMFYSYFITLQNLNQEQIHKGVGVKDVPRLAAYTFWVLFLPAVLGDLMTGQGPDDKEKKKPNAWEKWMLKSFLSYSMQGVVLVRDLANAIKNNYRYDVTPTQEAFELAVKLIGTVERKYDGKKIDGKIFAKDVASFIGIWGHLPSRQISATFGALYDEMNSNREVNWYEYLYGPKKKK